MATIASRVQSILGQSYLALEELVMIIGKGNRDGFCLQDWHSLYLCCDCEGLKTLLG